MDIKNIANIYECSPLQKGMLFHAVHQPETGLYIEQIRFSLSDALEKEVFRRAWEKTVERHDALRTTFHWKGINSQLQVVQKKIKVPWEEKSWDCPLYEADEKLNKTAEDIRVEPFDLEKGPLMKFCLIKLTDGYEFIWTFHHLLMDGWSMPLVLKDVLDFYHSTIRDEPLSLENTPQYGEYISWLNKQELSEALEFFRRKLEGLEEPSYLKTKPGNSTHSVQDQYRDCFISEQERTRLESLARDHNVTLFTVLQSLWALLINSRTDFTDVVMGTVMSGRRPEVRNSDRIVGPFINTLPLRIRLKREDTLLEVIQQVQKEQTELLQYEYTPLFEVQKVSGLSADKPLFDSIIVFENYPFDPKLFTDEKAGLAITRFQVEEKSNFPVSLAVIPYEGKLLLRLHFSSSAINNDDAEAILNRLTLFMNQVLDDVNKTVDSLQLKDEKETKKTVIHGRTLKQKITGPFTLHEQFEKQVLIYGNKIAVRSENDAYTYKELNRRSNQLAAHLVEKGLTTGQHVAVMMERSADLVIAILGILKAGGVYVPIDKHMPEERIRYILHDSEARFMIVGKKGQTASFTGITCIPVSVKQDIGGRTAKAEVSSLHSAYLMYTSGSTGEPKGVTVTHNAALLHYQSFKETFQLKESDKVLQFGTITFDPSTEQIFPTLFSGGEVFIRGEHLWDAQEFVDKVNEYEITIGNLPTPYWTEVVQYYRLTNRQLEMPSLRMLAIGGDKLSKAHAVAWNLVNKGETELYNFYGPTEIVTTCTYYKISKEVPDTPIVSIGIPFPNRKTYILDNMDRLVPDGKPGELYIGGPILSSGYHLKPAQTAERFLPDPFSTVPGGRMYRTGDIVASSPTGEIDFLGRNDDQLKIRGYRVETGEIEKALLTIPGVRQSIVKAESLSGRKTLYAYVTMDKAISNEELKASLKSMLPEYMIPRSIIVLDELPMLTNGKVDRKALPLPEVLENTRTSIAVPVNSLQEKMACIWEEVLRVDKVGIHDNYFELGGDSILALQIAAKCQEVNIHITTKDLFEHQTIENISLALENESDEYLNSNLTDLGGANGQPFTPIMKWFFEKELANPHHWNQSVFINSKEDLAVREFKQALTCMVEAHQAFQTRFIHNGDEWVQIPDDSPGFTFEVIDINGEAALDSQNKRIQEAQSSIDFSNGPLMKVLYFRNEKEKKYEVFFTAHHLIVDGVSWRILLEDLQSAYNQILKNEQVKLPNEGMSFKEWGHFLQNYAKSEKLAKEYPYWKKTAAFSTKIPRDFINSDIRNTEGSKVKKTISFTESETQYLLTGVNQTLDAKIQEILITSLILTLRKWTGNKQVKVDLEGHGREEINKGVQLSRTVGWFTALFPFLSDTGKNQSILESLTSTVRQIRSIPQNGIGFGILKYLTDKELKDNASDVSFNYLGQVMHSRENDFFEISNRSAEPIRSKESRRAYLIDVEGAVIGGKLSLDWMYSSYVHKDETIEILISTFVSTVKDIIALAKQFEYKLLLPKSFPKISLREDEWELVSSHSTDIEDIFPLSPVQEGMLFHTLMHPNSGVYVEQMAFRICGEFSVQAFSKAWDHVLASNSILRADFLWEGFTKPIHVINSEPKVQVEYEDWSGKSSLSAETDLEDLRRMQRLTGFIPGRDQMLKLKLICLNEETHYFIWTYHHLLLDGWSMPMVINQLSEAYRNIISGIELRRMASLSFGEFSFWQSTQDRSNTDEFWKENLLNYEQRAILVGTATKSNLAWSGHREIKRKLSLDLTGNLKTLASREKATLNTIVQCGWSLLLSFLGKKEQVIFGSVFSGRSAPVKGIEEMVGMFINTLPIGVKVTKKKSVMSLLSEIQNLQGKISQIEHMPLTEIKEIIGYKSKDPLFETCLIFANFPNMLSSDGKQQLLEGVSVQDVEIAEQTNFPLTVSIVPEDSLSLDINYSCSHFNEDDINLYLDLLVAVLSQMGTDSGCEVGMLMAEMEKLLLYHNQSQESQKKERNRSRLSSRKRTSISILS